MDFDVIVVGTGPSAIGLLYGILSPYANHSNESVKYSGNETNVDKTNFNRTPNFRIAVLERGNHSDTFTSKTIRDPLRWFVASHHDTTATELLSSTPQKGLNNRILSIPTGRGVGGGTNINACLAVKPNESDFEHWPKQWIEGKGVQPQDSEQHSLIMKSTLEIERVLTSNGFLIDQNIEVVKEVEQEKPISNEGSPYPCVSIDNCTLDNDQVKIYPVQYVAKENRERTNNLSYSRVNYYEGILKPFLDKNPHLQSVITFFTNAQVERLIIESNINDNPSTSNNNFNDWIVTGVEYKLNKNQETKIMKASKVILCAGAFYSPALLMVSGIGEWKTLQAKGITAYCPKTKIPIKAKHQEWNYVGKNLRDHLMLATLFFSFKNFFKDFGVSSLRGFIPLDIPMQQNKKVRIAPIIDDAHGFHYVFPRGASAMFLREIKFESKVLSSFVNKLMTMLYHINLFFFTILMISPIAWFMNKFSINVLLGILNMESRGYISIQKKRKAENDQIVRISQVDLIVDPAYLTTESDLEKVEYGVKALDKISPLLFPGATEIVPGSLYTDGKEYAKETAAPYFHWTGSCSMKLESSNDTTNKSNGYVLDKNLKVQNVEGLYVCDASAVPTNVSCNPSMLLAGFGFTSALFIEFDKCGFDKTKLKRQ